ncbi:MAG: hypothetical protein JKY60_00410 [Kordiimonadaceae bacterium]|nr:hypothetical protein [Kordiimonadaceae bacterium]
MDGCDASTGECTTETIEECCALDEDCDATGACIEATCDTAKNECTTTPIAGCCTADADCLDDDEATEDLCDLAINKRASIRVTAPVPYRLTAYQLASSTRSNAKPKPWLTHLTL